MGDKSAIGIDATPLQPRDIEVLDALCQDLADHGQGVPRSEIERIASTRWPDRIVHRLRRAGHRIGSVGTLDERYQLLDPASTEAPDERRPATDQGSGPAPAGIIRQASGASVDSELTLFEIPHAHYRAEAA